MSPSHRVRRRITPAHGTPAWDEATEPLPDWDRFGYPKPDFESRQRVAW